ncbi:MAG: hypothetical protein LBJ32_03555 [Oscillospiraceae bacterium]|jgi:hypothetical protein|nr:hypothetical protein [Oscillospiraceae bacterium]
MLPLILSFIFFIFSSNLAECSNQVNFKTCLIDTISDQAITENIIDKFKNECMSIYIFQKTKFNTIVCFSDDFFEKISKNKVLNSTTYRQNAKKISELLNKFQINNFQKNKNYKITISYNEINDSFFITHSNKLNVKPEIIYI